MAQTWFPYEREVRKIYAKGERLSQKGTRKELKIYRARKGKKRSPVRSKSTSPSFVTVETECSIIQTGRRDEATL